MSTTCRAANPLLCDQHGLWLYFRQVPAYITRDVKKLIRLYKGYVHAESELDSAALMEGVLPSEVGWVAYHHPDGAIPLRNLVINTHAARADFETERRRQTTNGVNYVTHQMHAYLPNYDQVTRYMLTNLVTLRFIVAERDYDDVEDGYLRTFGISREQLFAPLRDRKVRQLLMALDRAYLTAITGMIPEPEELRALAHERFVRWRGTPTEEDTERALDVLTEALTRHLEEVEIPELDADD
jgi:hypothetical protein